MHRTVIVLLALALAGCGQADTAAEPTAQPAVASEPAPTDVAAEAATPADAATPARPRGTIESEAPTVTGVDAPMPDGVTLPDPLPAPVAQQVDAARAELARLVGVAPEEVEVVAARSVTWPDGSLGCPLPEMAYPQVLVDGLFVRLRAGGQLYDYHGGGERALFLCAGKAGGRGLPNP